MACFIDPDSCLSWDTLLPYVLPFTVGVPDEVALQAIRQSCIEFCRRSGVLHDENYVDLQAYVHDYPLETSCDYEIVRIYEVVAPTMLVSFRPSIHKMRFPWKFGPFTFYVQQPNLIYISNPPQEDIPKGLEVEFIVQPRQDSCTLDNYLYESWAEGISNGAIARILRMPKTPWFDMGASREYNRLYMNDLTRARTAVDLNFGSGPVIAHMDRWI